MAASWGLPELGALRLVMTCEAAGDLWTYGLNLGGFLRSRGHAVTLAVLGRPVDTAQRHEAAARGLALAQIGYHPEHEARNAAEIEAAGDAVVALVRRCSAELLHLNHPALLAYARCPAPVTVSCHGCAATRWAAIERGPLPVDLRWRVKLTERGLAAAVVMMAPSEAFAEATRSAYGFGLPPRVVRPGVLPRPGVPAPSEPSDRIVFAAGPLWDEGQNLITLDRVAQRLTIPVLAAGPLTGQSGRTVRLHRITALGPLDRPALEAHLDRRPIFVSIALYDPFGLMVHEAARSGCALVLSDRAGFRELWEGAALLVPPHDEKGIAAAIQRLDEEPELRTALGLAAQRRSGLYSLEACARATERAYAFALATRTRMPNAAVAGR